MESTATNDSSPTTHALCPGGCSSANIQPIDAVGLENIVELRKIHENPSEQFLRFAEWYLSEGKADTTGHYNLVYMELY